MVAGVYLVECKDPSDLAVERGPMGQPLRVYRAAKRPLAYACVLWPLVSTTPLNVVLTHVDGTLMRLAILVLFVTVAAWLPVWMIRSATLVYPDSVVVRGLFRARRILWIDVAAIQVKPNPHGGPVFGVPARIPDDLMAVRDRYGVWTTLPHLNSRDLKSWRRTMNGELGFLNNRRARAPRAPQLPSGRRRRPGRRPE
jgi:hypothetical protein